MMPDYVTWSPPAMPEVPCAPAMATAVGAPGSPRRADVTPPPALPHSLMPGLACLSAMPGRIDLGGMPAGAALPSLTRIPWASDWHVTQDGLIGRAAIDVCTAALNPRLGIVNRKFHQMLCNGITGAESHVLRAKGALDDCMGGKDALLSVAQEAAQRCADSLSAPYAMAQSQMRLIIDAGSHCVALARDFAEETLALNAALPLWLFYASRLKRGMSLAELLSWAKHASLIRPHNAKFCFTSLSAWDGLEDYDHREIMAMINPRGIIPLVFPVFYTFLRVHPRRAMEMIDSPKYVLFAHQFEGRAIDLARLNLRMVDVIIRKGVLLDDDLETIREMLYRLGTVKGC